MTHFRRLRESELVQKPWSRSSPMRQISTRCSEIKNKLYGHHNDHSYAKDVLTMERVNDDCLAEIFMYLPVCERPKIALVCKQWKRALDYSWSNVKKLELTHWEYDEYPHFLKRIYPTIDRQFRFLKSLLFKCGRYLTKLDLAAYSHCNIVPVINESCPNLLELRIRIEYIDDAILDNAFTRLLKLKVLKIIFQCFKTLDTSIPVTLIKSLLNVADTLTELNLSNWSGCMEDNTNFPEETTSVVSQLKVLETLHIGGINFPQSLIGLILTNSQIKVSLDEYKYRQNKLTSQEIYKRVEKLNINNSRVTDDFLYNVANVMRELQTLLIYSTLITDAGIVAISKMTYLRNLDCLGFNNVTDSSIKLLKNMVLLILPYSNKITDESAIKVLENSPELRYIGVENTGVTSEFIKKAEEISRNRKQKLRVDMSCEDSIMSNKHIEYEYLRVNYQKRETRKQKVDNS
ncbi:F-box/LRR-repeat protein 12-like [Aphidius gifuensis]|uniref:F-box/LRR-repeat protein 12-like n=1 Tax=Aphidius gifuensis TaxID=684658 RepID=UPI001CDCA49A|nr:F-box/LRR-repeat protein 12-like [Aphidius gifuensis]